MANNILVVGRPGSGKTTLVVKLVERLAADGFKAGGFVTEEIREGRRRAGFCVRDLEGDTAVLAHVNHKGRHRVGKYGVDVEAFERVALPALEAGKTKADLLVVDEIGRMELFSSLFRTALVEILDEPVPLLATMHIASDPFTDAVRSRDDVSLHRIDPVQRERLMEVIETALRGLIDLRKNL